MLQRIINRYNNKQIKLSALDEKVIINLFGPAKFSTQQQTGLCKVWLRISFYAVYIIFSKNPDRLILYLLLAQ
jgi:hypothetical protein